MRLREIRPDKFEKVRSLFQGFDYSLSILAAIDGNNPGRIFVDDVDQPQTGFALTVEGYLLAGDTNNPHTNRSLKRLLSEKIFTGEYYVNGDESMSLAVHPQAWEELLPWLIPTHAAEKLERYHYICKALKFDWRSQLPEGYAIHRLDGKLLNDPEVIFADPLRSWMDIPEFWWTEDNFISKGVSFVILYENTVVAWCNPDCVANDRIDVGIITHPGHRRKGLAACVAAATVEHCLKHGFSAIGWHCNAENTGSWKTAEKVGFERNRTYAYYYYVYNLIDHLAELGWYHYRHEEYDQTVRYYDQVFAMRDEHPDYYYHLAASAWALLKNKEKALHYLRFAADRGWSNVDWTKQQAEFSLLHGTPEWEEILRRMQASGR